MTVQRTFFTCLCFAVERLPQAVHAVQRLCGGGAGSVSEHRGGGGYSERKRGPRPAERARQTLPEPGEARHQVRGQKGMAQTKRNQLGID